MLMVFTLIIFGSIVFLYNDFERADNTPKDIKELKMEIKALEEKSKLLPKMDEIQEFIKTQETYIDSLKLNLGLKIEKILSKLPVFVILDVDEDTLFKIQNDKMLNLAYRNLATKLFGITEPKIKFIRRYLTSENFEEFTSLDIDYLEYVNNRPIKVINTTGDGQVSYFRYYDKVDEKFVSLKEK